MPLEEQSSTPGSEPRRKRAKIVSACGECRRKKTKCNGETPCRNCEKSGVQCIYPSSSSNDDKRNAPSKAALEAIEERLKSIEDMLRAIIKTQQNSNRESTSPSPFHSNKSSPKTTPASPIHLPSIRNFPYSNEQQQQQLPPLGFQNYSYQDSSNMDKKRKR